MTVAAQKFSWPPKSYPLSVPFIVSDEVKYYWGVDAIVCVGSEMGDINFSLWEEPIMILHQAEL